MCPILPVWSNYLLKDGFDFSITYLYLPIRLGVVWCGDAVMYSVLLQQCPEVSIIEVLAAVADDSPRTTIPDEDASCDKSQYLSMIVCPSVDCLNPLGHIIHRYQYVLFPIRRSESPMKSIPHRSRISTSRIGRIGISSLLEMFNAA